MIYLGDTQVFKTIFSCFQVYIGTIFNRQKSLFNRFLLPRTKSQHIIICALLILTAPKDESDEHHYEPVFYMSFHDLSFYDLFWLKNIIGIGDIVHRTNTRVGYTSRIIFVRNIRTTDTNSRTRFNKLIAHLCINYS
ncbi:hypothetical protein D3C72_1659150 [compost metagenome]